MKKNKDYVKEKAKEGLKKLAQENPEKLKEYRRKAYQKQKDIVLLKQQAAKKLNYLYEIWIYDNKGDKVDFYD
jgi:hypothetical protein